MYQWDEHEGVCRFRVWAKAPSPAGIFIRGMMKKKKKLKPTSLWKNNECLDKGEKRVV